MALWFATTLLDDEGDIMDQQIHGPFTDADVVDETIDEIEDEAVINGEASRAASVVFELLDDDIPELVLRGEVNA